LPGKNQPKQKEGEVYIILVKTRSTKKNVALYQVLFRSDIDEANAVMEAFKDEKPILYKAEEVKKRPMSPGETL